MDTEEEGTFSEADLKSALQLLQLMADQPTPASQIEEFIKTYQPQGWVQDPQTGWTALHYAALRNDLAVATLLLQRTNARWEIVDNTGSVSFKFLCLPVCH